MDSRPTEARKTFNPVLKQETRPFFVLFLLSLIFPASRVLQFSLPTMECRLNNIKMRASAEAHELCRLRTKDKKGEHKMDGERWWWWYDRGREEV